MFERFDEPARRAIFFSLLQARVDAASSISSLHLLKGTLHADPELAALLRGRLAWGMDETSLEGSDQLHRSAEAGSGSKELPLSPNAKRALMLAASESDRLGWSSVTCRHLVIGLLATTGSSAARELEPISEVVYGLREDSTPGYIPILLLGLGGVGRALVRQALELREFHFRQFGLALRFKLVADSEAVVVTTGAGASEVDLASILQLKSSGKSLAEVSEIRSFRKRYNTVCDNAGPGSIVVDCSASFDTCDLLAELAGKGARLALANKKPLTGPQSLFDRIAGPERPPLRSRWESTVGAGLPVIAALNRLYAAGDTVQRVLGSVSSTLGYVMTGLQEGRRFSELIQEVMRAGYTERDPREDLLGADVARKAVIMARTLGWSAELHEVAVERLYPEEMDQFSVGEFMHQLPRLDAGFLARSLAASERGNVLRYAASVSAESIQVGVTEVSLQSPLGRLTGTNQIVQVESRWYNPNPLVIQGRGAGVDATAAGLMADIVELALGLKVGPSRGRLESN